MDGDLVAVEVARHGRLGLPVGSVVERLGSLKSERAVSLIAIHAHGLPHVFSRSLIAEAEAARPATLEGREDWRNVPFVTIDPPDAKDHDDAVHATPDPNCLIEHLQRNLADAASMQYFAIEPPSGG